MSLRCARSPLAPKTTTAHGSGSDSARRPGRRGLGISSCSGAYGIKLLVLLLLLVLVLVLVLVFVFVFRFRFRFAQLFFTACPPNSFRSAACTLALKDSSWREAMRCRSERVMTGAGTFWAKGARTRPRASPPSSP